MFLSCLNFEYNLQIKSKNKPFCCWLLAFGQCKTHIAFHRLSLLWNYHTPWMLVELANIGRISTVKYIYIFMLNYNKNWNQWNPLKQKVYDTYSPCSLPWYWLTLQLVQCFLAKSWTKSQPSCFVLVLQNIFKNTINQFDAREFRDCFLIIIQSYKTKYILFIPLCSRRVL